MVNSLCKRGGIKGQLIDTVKLIQYTSFWYNARMRKNRVIEQNRCYHLVSRLAHRAFFLDDEEKGRAVALMRHVEAGIQDSMSYCINRAVSISSDLFVPLVKWGDTWVLCSCEDCVCNAVRAAGGALAKD